MSTTQGIKLDESTQARLKALAEKRKRSPHWLIRTTIESKYLTGCPLKLTRLEHKQYGQ